MEQILGGVIIGLAASIMLLFNGRVTGISGILGGLLNLQTLDKSWRVLFIAGLFLGGLLLVMISPSSFAIMTNVRTFDYIIAGLLVGFGTLLGNGCTSGHGVCGISRLSIRSVIATCAFILSGIFSVWLFSTLRGEL